MTKEEINIFSRRITQSSRSELVVITYEIIEKKVKANVNHVMEEEHYIEWFLYVQDDKHELIHFEPYMIPEAEFDYVAGAKLYAYCNKHGLWMSEVK